MHMDGVRDTFRFEHRGSKERVVSVNVFISNLLRSKTKTKNFSFGL